MPHLRIALAQTNPTVGAIDANADALLDWCRRADDAGAQLVLLPEMALVGYPVEDLALRQAFVQHSAEVGLGFARRLAEAGLGDLVVVLGFLDATDQAYAPGRRTPAPQNKAAILHQGEVVTTYAKHHLPNYGVFDESRYFHPGTTVPVLTIGGIDVAVAICEDLWVDGDGPVAAARRAGAGLLAVINASPYEAAKDDVRGELVTRRAREAGCAVAYVNLVGGQDELVFDGDSMISSADGELVARAPQFVEDLLVADLELPAATGGPTDEAPGPDGMMIIRHQVSGPYEPPTEPVAAPQFEKLPDLAEVWWALKLGLADYCGKNGITDVWLGLSGGIDSTLVAALACDALGAEHVHGISNPSVHSSEHSRTDAQQLAANTGLDFSTVPIATMVDAFSSVLDLDGIAAENLQARIRGVVWMAQSNQHGPSIVLACSNKSELSVGYSTMYGDAVGGFAPIKDVYKTQVWELARWRNAEAVRLGEVPPIPENTITKAPSAELRPGQVDSDSLPAYDLLDPILDHYVESDLSLSEIVAEGYDEELVARIARMVDAAEYKRRQFPPGTKISFKAFGRDRRLPITNGWRGA
ncbi:NAD+ synthase [Microlunatus sp. Y2014]|uniref:NAD+ synthase n=1 Tax=Microlunatus sp. Y2014 TaxID=3418488 RepID=UPI003DA7381D